MYCSKKNIRHNIYIYISIYSQSLSLSLFLYRYGSNPHKPPMKPRNLLKKVIISLHPPKALRWYLLWLIRRGEAGSTQTERFVRSAAPATPGTLVELRVWRPKKAPGWSQLSRFVQSIFWMWWFGFGEKPVFFFLLRVKRFFSLAGDSS